MAESLKGQKTVCSVLAGLLLLAGCAGPGEAPVTESAGPDPEGIAAAPAAPPETVAAELEQLAADTGADFSVAVQDNNTGASWSYNPDGRYLEASLVKVPILLTLVRQATAEQRSLTAEEENLAAMMIEYSDNGATSELYRRVGGRTELNRTYELIGVSDTEAGETWGANETTAQDQLRIARTAAQGADWLDADLLEFAVGLMENVCPEQNWGISAGVQDDGAEVALKNGWLQDDDAAWNVGSAGFVRTGGSDYSIVVLSSRNSTLPEGIEAVEGVAATVNGYEDGG